MSVRLNLLASTLVAALGVVTLTGGPSAQGKTN